LLGAYAWWTEQNLPASPFATPSAIFSVYAAKTDDVPYCITCRESSQFKYRTLASFPSTSPPLAGEIDFAMSAWLTLSLGLCLASVHAAPVLDVPMSSWMTALYPVIANLTLLDLSLPGTHDSVTFDLSTSVS
jgi:hypothetical protein